LAKSFNECWRIGSDVMSVVVKVKTKITHEWVLSLTSEEAKDLLTMANIIIEQNRLSEYDKYMIRVSENIVKKFVGLDLARAQLSENNGD